MQPYVISRRQAATHDNHHLWNNHGSWWFHATFHAANGTKERIRRNLHTRDLAEARAKRDRLIARFSPVTAQAC